MNVDALTILDRIDQYVYLKDRNGVYRYANELFAKIAGQHSRSAIIGKTDRDVWGDDAEWWIRADADVLAGQSVVRAEETHRYADGEFKIVITKTPYRDGNGDIVGILGNFCDTTGRLILQTRGTFDYDKHRLYLEFVPEWLSAAEVRICFYLMQGFAAPRMAEKINTSVSTVRFHIENIKEKMQCANKGEIVEVLMRKGIAWKIFSLQHVDDIDPANGQ